MHDAIDRFQEAVRATLGNAPDQIEPGRLHRFSTNGKRSDTSGWCRLFEDQRGGMFGDWRAGLQEMWTVVGREQMTRAERAAMQRHIAAAKAERAAAQRVAWRKADINIRHLWRQCRPVSNGDAVDQYLRKRLALDSFEAPCVIRLHRAMPYVYDGEMIGEWPAMVAPMLNAAGRLVALHRTYLTDDGRKADVPGPVRKLTPACGLLVGGSIRLHEPQAGLLGVAEGVETALAAFCASGVPTVAAYSAGALASFVWPSGLRRLLVFADHDDAGTKAADELQSRVLHAGLAVEIRRPVTPGADWCDVWATRDAVVVQTGSQP